MEVHSEQLAYLNGWPPLLRSVCVYVCVCTHEHILLSSMVKNLCILIAFQMYNIICILLSTKVFFFCGSQTSFRKEYRRDLVRHSCIKVNPQNYGPIKLSDKNYLVAFDQHP